MNRTEYDAQTGQTSIVVMTAEEIAAIPPYIAPKVEIVTRLQMMEAMIELLLWDEFKAARLANDVLNEYWLASLEVYRFHPMVLSMGKTDAELDALFLLASTK